jgi:hypothetical protein
VDRVGFHPPLIELKKTYRTFIESKENEKSKMKEMAERKLKGIGSRTEK